MVEPRLRKSTTSGFSLKPEFKNVRLKFKETLPEIKANYLAKFIYI